MLQIGSAAVDITPPVGTHLAGQFNDRVAVTIHDPLNARALVLDDGTTRVALVACDLISHRRPTILKARELAEAATGIPARNILIAASHTHTGPPIARGLSWDLDQDYARMLPRHLASAVALADQARQPGQVAVGSGWEPSASHNRRFLKKDGTAQMHPPKGDPAFVGPEGPDDPEVGVLVARGEHGQLLGAIVNYTSHPIVVGHELAVSADYPGYLVRAVEAVEGGPGKVLFINGAFGNICPIDVYDLKHREYGWAWAERVGKTIAAEAIRVIETTDPLESPRIRVASTEVELGIRSADDAQIEAARALRARGEIVWRGDMTPEERAAHREWVYANEIILLAEERAQSPTVRAEVQAIAIGDAAFVSAPGELFVEFGHEIKRRSPFLHTYIAGMANDCAGYIPTEHAMRNGGYETRLARSSKLVPEAGSIVVEAALRMLAQVAQSSAG
ncbi:MAG: hypothetical protein ACRDIY_12685 [Chloroflexota bacterium]